MAYNIDPASYAMMLRDWTSSKSAPGLRYKSSTSSMSTDDEFIMGYACSFCLAAPPKYFAACRASSTVLMQQKIV